MTDFDIERGTSTPEAGGIPARGFEKIAAAGPNLSQAALNNMMVIRPLPTGSLRSTEVFEPIRQKDLVEPTFDTTVFPDVVD